MEDHNRQQLIERAVQARENAYAPYSGFKVGSAILTTDGRIFTGCNVENAAYGDTICAERVALFTAVAAGVTQFQALAVVTDVPKPAFPCGSCRQALAEFGIDLTVVCANLMGKSIITNLRELLPKPFIEREMR